jgi:hypothetical protein
LGQFWMFCLYITMLLNECRPDSSYEWKGKLMEDRPQLARR